MIITPHYPLLEHNTFKVNVKARWWVAYHSIDDLLRLARDEYFATLPFMQLGGGSNTLFLRDYEGAVLHSGIEGIEVLPSTLDDNPNCVYVKVGSGIVWDDFVCWALNNRFYGVENLSGIPGSVGASAVQNIGAYGCEVADYIERVHTFDLSTAKEGELSAKECAFGYRSSIFKTDNYKELVITHVVYRLKKKSLPNLTYAALANYFANANTEANAEKVREAVISIRNQKLPDPKVLPNGGSFFKNPMVLKEQCADIATQYPSLQSYPVVGDENHVKLSAAWLIEQTGYKGRYIGNVGCYEKQPLVIVNKDGLASGKEIADFAHEVAQDVYKRFGILLEPEVRYV